MTRLSRSGLMSARLGSAIWPPSSLPLALQLHRFYSSMDGNFPANTVVPWRKHPTALSGCARLGPNPSGIVALWASASGVFALLIRFLFWKPGTFVADRTKKA